MKKILLALVVVTLVAGLILVWTQPGNAGGRRAEGAFLATFGVTIGHVRGVVPMPRPLFYPPRREVVIIYEPAPVYYYPAPAPLYDPPRFERYWVPGHWENDIWVEGHYEQRPVDPGYTRYSYSQPYSYSRPYRSYYPRW